MTDRPTADTITDDELDALYARIKTLEHVAAGNKRHVQLIVPELENADAARRVLRDRAEQAEAAIERVRRAVQEASTSATPVRAGRTLAGQLVARVLAALDGAPGPAAAEAIETENCCGKPAGAICVHDVMPTDHTTE
ncbi:hypothetical protein GKQ77_01815 [Streptomyces sp. BG9H]|uniref:Uncharacterized protein n=1 Tax=Streptomyces anatolicus TaxID=2675858 RepID=A0ABS6YFZ3_9ACTN|nr:hypothetical protein [Streptomyces anatolicus]MBW5420308.1 hypothetical protein [Streptomyces anatolicus]